MTKKYKILSWIGIAITIAVFILVNVFMTILTKKMPLKIDLTENKTYDLTAESYEYLKGYDKDTTIYIISPAASQNKWVRAVLDRYEAVNPHIKITNVDTVKNPGFGREYVKDGEQLNQHDLVVVSGDMSIVIQSSKIASSNQKPPEWLNVETKVTSALKYVSSDAVFSACFTTGHREDSFASAKEALGSENYTSVSVNLFSGDIPEDTSVVIIALPKSDFSNSEIAKLDAYVRAGGAVQVYVDSECPELPNLNSYLTSNGITISESGIVEANDHIRRIQYDDKQYMLFAADYSNNDVLNKIIEKGKALFYVPFSKAINTAPTAGNITVEPYLTSSSGSGTTTDYKSTDSHGSSNIALMSTNSETGGMIYVSGTPILIDMYSVSEIDEVDLGNVEYFVTVTNSMTGAGDTFVVPVKSVSQNIMHMSIATGQRYFVVTIILLPGIALAMGLIVFFKRRNM
ncbi:MAG: GldG family protein [Oscillospiraceae bacterium]|nr:GldG family protein [Oscillospiraceae bacterium]